MILAQLRETLCVVLEHPWSHFTTAQDSDAPSTPRQLLSHVPAKITRINIACQALLKAVELFPHEMHLARQHGLVTFASEIMGVRGHIATEWSRIVPHSNPGWELTGAQ